MDGTVFPSAGPPSEETARQARKLRLERYGSAVIYSRVSTIKQNTLWDQVLICREFCDRNGLSIAGAFSDIGSGHPARKADLPGRNQAVRLARKKNALIVVRQGCRFSRELLHECPYAAWIVAKRVVSAYRSDGLGGFLSSALGMRFAPSPWIHYGEAPGELADA